VPPLRVPLLTLQPGSLRLLRAILAVTHGGETLASRTVADAYSVEERARLSLLTPSSSQIAPSRSASPSTALRVTPTPSHLLSRSSLNHQLRRSTAPCTTPSRSVTLPSSPFLPRSRRRR
jgi:hypothetical protein